MAKLVAQRQRKFHAAYLGSFDPLTLGHLDVIERSAKLFPSVLVGIGQHGTKQPCLTLEERLESLLLATQSFKTVFVATFEGLAVEFARSYGVKTLIRGLRTESDYNYEMQMAMINRSLGDDLETIFIPTRQEYTHISSSLVKEVVALGGEVPHLVPKQIYRQLLGKLRPSKKPTRVS